VPEYRADADTSMFRDLFRRCGRAIPRKDLLSCLQDARPIKGGVGAKAARGAPSADLFVLSFGHHSSTA
jgi:hypothetical protein